MGLCARLQTGVEPRGAHPPVWALGDISLGKSFETEVPGAFAHTKIDIKHININ